MFADRDKDMLKVGGENVAASEIERVIYRRPGRARMCGRRAETRHARRGAGRLRHPSRRCSASAHAKLSADILAACKRALADFKVPRAVHIVADMPRSTLEKVNKAELRKTLPIAG